MKRFLNLLILISFCFSNLYAYPAFASVDSVTPNLLKLTSHFEPLTIKGLKLYPDNPFKFDFIFDEGNTAYADSQLKDESVRLINYFFNCPYGS